MKESFCQKSHFSMENEKPLVTIKYFHTLFQIHRGTVHPLLTALSENANNM